MGGGQGEGKNYINSKHLWADVVHIVEDCAFNLISCLTAKKYKIPSCLGKNNGGTSSTELQVVDKTVPDPAQCIYQKNVIPNLCTFLILCYFLCLVGRFNSCRVRSQQI